MAAVCLQVCTACGDTVGGAPAGRCLYEALLVAAAGDPEIEVAPVDCLAVCDRPVTLAFQGIGPGRWTYLVGGADPGRDLDDILAAAKAVAASPHGIPAMDDRPPFFRQGVIGRLPPLSPAPSSG
jgi:predicted metal-binding protein